jgi:DNA replication protein DnaC
MACEICNNEGFWFDEMGKMIVCTCRQKEILNAKKESYGITPRMAKQTLESFDLSFYTGNRKKAAQTALNASREFIERCIDGEEVEGMVFLGSVGSGKTYLASAIIGKLIENKVDAKIILLHDFMDELRAAVKDDSPQRLINQVKVYKVLAIDDLGADNNTDFAISAVFSILNYRINYELPTIITTNLSYKQIEEVYGSRICSRITEMCRFYPLDSDKDIRLAKKQKARENNARKK